MSGGQLVVIKRSGGDGARYPLPKGHVTLGRDSECHIRVMLPTISEQHAIVTIHQNQSIIRNLSTTSNTLLNGTAVTVASLNHGDIITLGDRSLRWEYYKPELVKTNLPNLKVKTKGRRRATKRPSDIALRRLDPDMQTALLQKHRASLPAAGERQVAIVQPQRRGENTGEQTELKTKVPPKQKKGASRGAKNNLDKVTNEIIRKSTRGNQSPSTTMDISTTTSTKKVAKKTLEATNINTKEANTFNNESIEFSEEKDSTKKGAKKTPSKNNDAENLDKKTEDNDTPRQSRLRKSIANVATTLKVATPRTRISRHATPVKPAQILGVGYSQFAPMDLAEIVAKGTPKNTPRRGPVKHVSTPRPKFPYVRGTPLKTTRSAFKDVAIVQNATPRVNPLLKKAVTARVTPARGIIKPAVTPRVTPMRNAAKKVTTPTLVKRNIVEKIEEPTNIDAQKKSALMALTGRSPVKKLLTPQPSTSAKNLSPKYVIPKKTSPIIVSRSPRPPPKRASLRGAFKRGIPVKTPSRTDTPRVGSRAKIETSLVIFGRKRGKNTPGPSKNDSVLETESTKKGQKRSLRNETVENEISEIDLIKERPGKLRKADQYASPSPSNQSTRQSEVTTPITMPKSVLRSPLSPRKNESIKFDLSNLERSRSISVPPSPKNPSKTRGRSSVVETPSNVRSRSSVAESPAYIRDKSSVDESPAKTRGRSSIAQSPLNAKGSFSVVESPTKTRGRSSVAQSPLNDKGSSSVVETPTKTRGRSSVIESPANTRGRSSVAQSPLNDKGSSSVVETPTKTRGRFSVIESPANTRGRSSVAQSPLNVKGSSSVVESPAKTRGRSSVVESPTNTRGRSSVAQSPLNAKGSSSVVESPTKTRGKSSVVESSLNIGEISSLIESTSDEDLLLHLSDESDSSVSPSARRSIQSRGNKMVEKSLNGSFIEHTLHEKTLVKTPGKRGASQSPSPKRKSRGSLMVQKALDNDMASPTLSEDSISTSYSRSTWTNSRLERSATQDKTGNLTYTPKKSVNVTYYTSDESLMKCFDDSKRTSYSRRSTMTKSQLGSLTPNQTQNLTKSLRSERKSDMESYSVIDLVSIDSTKATPDSSLYDSASSISSSIANSNYNTPARNIPSRGKSLNISLETSTPMIKPTQTLSTRKALLKSATIASALKRSRSTPAATAKSTPASKGALTPKSTRRSKSLTLTSKNNDTRMPDIVIEDSTLLDATITPKNSRGSRRSNNTPNQSPMVSETHSPSPRVSKTPKVSPNVTKNPVQSPSGTSSLTKSPSQSPGVTPRLTKSSVQSPRGTPRSNKSFEDSLLRTRLTRTSGQSLSILDSPKFTTKAGRNSSQSPSVSSKSSQSTINTIIPKSPDSSRKSIQSMKSFLSPEIHGKTARTRRSGQSLILSGSSPSVLSIPGTPKSPNKSSIRKSGSPISARMSLRSPISARKADQSVRKSARSSLNASASEPTSRKSGQTPDTKRQSASLGDVFANASKRQSTPRGKSLLELNLQGDEPRTPENQTSPEQATTPVLDIQEMLNQSQGNVTSVKEAVKRFEARAAKSVEPKRNTRKTIGGISQRIMARKNSYEAFSEKKSWTDPKKKSKVNKRISGRSNLSAFKKAVASKRTSDESSIASDKTDGNAPKPDNGIVITPKSTVQLVPEGVRGKHSTAKKPVSRISIIDHLNISQEVVKNLFNSPVKRKLSRSMTQYGSQLSDSENEASTSLGRQSRMSALTGKTPNVSFDFDNIKTPRVPTEMFVSPMDTPMPPSPNLVGLKRLFGRNTPANDLRNICGVKTLLRTPRSPKNDLTRVSRIKNLFDRKSPKNDLRNVGGVKKLLKTPKGKQKSPKNDLTDVRGVRGIFRQKKSVQNEYEDLSGVEELLGNSNSTIKETESTMSEFDKLVGKNPVRSYSRSKSMTAKKPLTPQKRSAKSLTEDLQTNVEEWLEKELQKQVSKHVSINESQQKKSLSKSFQDSSTSKTPQISTRNAVTPQPASARAQRELKKLTIDAIGGDIPIQTDRRSRRTLTAEKSNFSLEISKVLTSAKKVSIPKIIEERISLPFKKRGHSNERFSEKRASKTPKRKAIESLNNSIEALNAGSTLSLPIKKRVLKGHDPLVHSTPMKERPKRVTNDRVSVDLGPVSPIASSPNVTPRKNKSLREALNTEPLESVGTSRNAPENIISKEPDTLKYTKKTWKGRQEKAQKSPKNVAPLPNLSPKVVPKTRARRGAKSNDNENAEPKTLPKKTTRGRKANMSVKSKTQSPKLIVAKKLPKLSPVKPTNSTRGRNAEEPQKPELTAASPIKSVSKTRGSKTQNERRASLIVGKKAPKMGPQKPKPTKASPPKPKRGGKAQKTEDKAESPMKLEPKALRGRKVQVKSAVKESPPKRGRKVPAEIPVRATPPKRGRKVQVEAPAKESPPKRSRTIQAGSPKKGSPRRGRKAVQNQPEVEQSSVRARRKRLTEDLPEVTGVKVKVTRARKVEESPKKLRSRKETGSAQKHVSFAPDTVSPLKASASRGRATRRKADTSVEELEASRPAAKRGRGGKQSAKEIESPVKKSAVAKATRRGRQSAAAKPKESPKAARTTRSTRQKK